MKIKLVRDFKKQCPFYKDDDIFKIVIDFLREQEKLINEKIEREYIKKPDYEKVYKKAVKKMIRDGFSELAAESAASYIPGVLTRTPEKVKPSGCPRMEGGEG